MLAEILTIRSVCLVKDISIAWQRKPKMPLCRSLCNNFPPINSVSWMQPASPSSNLERSRPLMAVSIMVNNAILSRTATIRYLAVIETSELRSRRGFVASHQFKPASRATSGTRRRRRSRAIVNRGGHCAKNSHVADVAYVGRNLWKWNSTLSQHIAGTRWHCEVSDVPDDALDIWQYSRNVNVRPSLECARTHGRACRVAE